MEQREVKGLWIPIEIWKDKSLSWNEKILFLEIDSFTSKDKDCYMSDEYIAGFLGVSETYANKILSSLIKKGYVIKTSFDGRRRYVKSALTITTRQGCTNEQGRVEENDNIPISSNNINLPNEKEKDKSFSKKNEKDELFEECWKAYKRKGSKAKAKTFWNKLSNEDKNKVKLHIPHYVSSVSEITYIKDFERYLKDKIFLNVVYKNNATLFDPERINNLSEYTPQCDGISLIWNDVAKCYLTPFDITTLSDGYTKDNRPNGAVVMWRGYKYKWNGATKQWEIE